MPVTAAIASAVHFYSVAGTAVRRNEDNRRTRHAIWATEIDKDEKFEKCPQVKTYFAGYRAQGGTIVDRSGPFILRVDILPVIWSCASDQLDEAERLLQQAPCLVCGHRPRAD